MPVTVMIHKVHMNAAVQFVALVTYSGGPGIGDPPSWLIFVFSVCPDKYRNNASNLVADDPFFTLFHWGNCNNKNCPERASERNVSVSLPAFWTIWQIFAKYGMHFLCSWFRVSQVYINKCPTRCNSTQSVFYFTARSLYVFRVPSTPIIRST